jgi:hypothetical protein
VKVADRALVPAASVDQRELARAQTIFDELSRKTYNVDLKDLTPDPWSFSPSFGSIVVEFKTVRSCAPSQHLVVHLGRKSVHPRPGLQ